MDTIYLDLHIHTSENPNNLNTNYDIDTLLEKIDKLANQSDFLISLTDHNTINKTIYLEAKQKVKNLLLGTELHVRNYENAKPYHCHIYFNLKEITDTIIDDINQTLDELYPDKVISKDDPNVPSLETIIKAFDSYEIIFLPHGGQSHSTFDKSIPEGVQFDNIIERSIYYSMIQFFYL
ncbi:MAG: hypothetical protein GY710_09020 [Desulfobacteraceae bacterium]|nr:hypothetical protein [Desulfobacteraceae bacterium]